MKKKSEFKMNHFLVKNQFVIDKRTGLMWTRNASLLDFPMSWNEAFNAVKELNRSNLYGYNDWKIPNRRELFSLISHKMINPSLPSNHPFTNVFPGYYWTSSTCARLPNQAWYIHLGGARVFKGMKHASYMVWPVRANKNHIGSSLHHRSQNVCFDEAGSVIFCERIKQDVNKHLTESKHPKNRFTKNQEIVFDNATELMWFQNANAFKDTINWDSAIHLIVNMNSEMKLGYNDWRMPNIIELESLIDLSQHSPALPVHHFFTNVKYFYWSSTTSAYESTYAWVLYMVDGAVGVGYKPLPEFYLWPVRGKKNLLIQ